jgi:hypothetical protein
MLELRNGVNENVTVHTLFNDLPRKVSMIWLKTHSREGRERMKDEGGRMKEEGGRRNIEFRCHNVSQEPPRPLRRPTLLLQRF